MAKSCFLGLWGLLFYVSAVPAQSYLFVSSSNTNSVLRYDAVSGSFIDTFATGGNLLFPAGLAINPTNGHLLVAGTGNDAVLQFNINTGTPMGLFTIGGTLAAPDGMAFGNDGKLYVSGGLNANVQRFNANGTFDAIYGDANSGGGTIIGITGLAFGGPNGQLHASCVHISFLSNVQRFPFAGGTATVFTTGPQPDLPAGVVFGPDGNLYVADALNNSVLRYNGTTGAFINAFVPADSGGLVQPYGLVFGPDGNLYVSSYNASPQTSMVKRFNGITGAFIDDFATGGGLDNPTYLMFYSVAVPEPATIALTSLGLSLTSWLGWSQIKRRKRNLRRHRLNPKSTSVSNQR